MASGADDTRMDRPTKLAFSKYDFVKVRVYINEKHYYVLSRFLVSRVLTAARVNYHGRSKTFYFQIGPIRTRYKNIIGFKEVSCGPVEAGNESIGTGAALV
jgi:hypothetical protein